MKWRIKVLVFAVLFLAGVALAQSDRATINGSVTDASGAVVPGVEVKARNLDTNDVQRVVTNESGLYYVRKSPDWNLHSDFLEKPGSKAWSAKASLSR